MGHPVQLHIELNIYGVVYLRLAPVLNKEIPDFSTSDGYKLCRLNAPWTLFNTNGPFSIQMSVTGNILIYGDRLYAYYIKLQFH